MRLTLRTLLAYLDNILEPNDRSNLEEKIKESEFARSLMERIQRVSVQSDLGAPPVAGRGVGRDASSVAEYLDNTMAPEQIQEFERICLESDIHLAEVTCCHNVLTIVLGQPAKVSAVLRERMYRLNEGTVIGLPEELNDQPEDERELAEEPPELPMSTAAESALASGPAESAATDIRKPSPKTPSVQDQPEPSSDSRFWIAMALTAVIAAALMGVLLKVFDRPSADRAPTTVGEFAKKDQDAAPSDVSPPQASPDNGEAATSPLDNPPPLDDTPPATDAAAPPKTAADDAADAPPTVDDVPAVDAPPPTDAVAADSAPAASAEPAAAATEPEPMAVEQPMADAPEDTAPKDVVPDTAEPPGGDALAKANGAVEPPLAATDESAATDADETTATDPPASAPVIVGRLLSHDQVLLRTDAAMDVLTRLPAQSPLNIGDRLISLPAFRPMISATSTTIELEGGSSIELMGVDAGRVPQVAIHYGQVIIRSLATPNTRLRLRLGQQAGTLAFDTADSAVGIEVRPYLTAGSDPENSPPTHAVDLYVVQGKVTWKTPQSQQSHEAPARVMLSRHPFEPSGGDAQPDWLKRSTLTALDKRGITEIEQRLRPDRSVTLSLSELAEHRRWEIRRLALRGCAHVAYFDPLVKALRDKDVYAQWYDLFVPQLTAAVARGPAIAAKVRKTFEKTRGESAPELYRMLWGYSREDLIAGGEAKKLVGYLDHEELDFRVLSFGNLRQLTELGLNYRPQDNQLQRKQSVQRWAKKADKDEIVPLTTARPDAG
ncbi:MAG: hypothetical protein OES79_00485 [Planctomycetota bacterium]|nr:hypothetical protein [Planctomycetota bacterium]